MIWPYTRGTRTRATPAHLDAWLPPSAIELERHTLPVAADPGATLKAIDEVRWRELPVVRGLFTFRGLPHDGGRTIREFFVTPPFVLLEEAPGREVVFGVLGPFWQYRRGGLPPRVARSPDEFRHALADGTMAAIGSYGVERVGAGTLLWTETWVSAPGAAQRAAFSAYWLAIGPFSAWIRRMMLRAARRRATLSSAA
jgi:hypothetical protein